MPPINPNLSAAIGDDTIVALSTARGRSAIGIIRLSGPQAVSITNSLVPKQRFQPRTAILGNLINDQHETLDQVLVTLFAGPASYTGEDVVEISCHGSLPVLHYTIERALELGARLAEPGEFTRRAYLNGRMDLVQAEAVRDLIDSTTLYQAHIAASQTSGALSAELRHVKQKLVELISMLEAGIDFAEDDIAVASGPEILEKLEPVRERVTRLAKGFEIGKIVRDGFKLAILGRPNVGKSSLFNCLLESNRAIVHEVAGTTRDVISESASFEGIPVELIDTAGIRTTPDSVESEGVQRSWQSLAGADCALVVVDLSQQATNEDHALWEQAKKSSSPLLVGNKQDLDESYQGNIPTIKVSAKTGFGIENLRNKIREHALSGLDTMQEGSFVTNIRQERLLRESLLALDKATEATNQQVPHEMLLLDLYEALQPLDAITGSTTMDDILEQIFTTFCIGK